MYSERGVTDHVRSVRCATRSLPTLAYLTTRAIWLDTIKLMSISLLFSIISNEILQKFKLAGYVS
jgi:hypothetical protein